MMKTKLLLLAFMTLIFSCKQENPLKVNVEKVKVEKLSIKRYEQQLFNVPQDSFIAKANAIQKDYMVFLEGNIKDTSALLGLRNFFQDHYMLELFQLSQKTFPELNTLENQLNESFRYLKYHFPKVKTPKVYTYISGLDVQSPVKYVDDNLIIGLDLYLGSETEAYKLSGFPSYVVSFMSKDYLQRDILSEMGRGLMPEIDRSADLLNNMIYYGKILYFIRALAPEMPESIVLKFKSSQLEWMDKYEAQVWSFILENKYLFEKNPLVKNKFLNEGPFSTMFAKESPARIGYYIGFKIVSKYMEESGSGIEKLFTETDYQKIFTLSKYKPKI